MPGERVLIVRDERPLAHALELKLQHEDGSRVLGAGAKKYFIKSNTPLPVIIEEVKKA